MWLIIFLQMICCYITRLLFSSFNLPFSVPS
nr:MAG TPA_asm: Protein of unknown function (DUF4029) [Bacteriophage sp.]